MPIPGVMRRLSKAMPTIIQALAIMAVIHLTGQGLLTQFGGAKYRFTKSYSNYGSGKVQSVIKYIDKNIPKYTRKTKSTTPTTTTTTTTPAPPPPIEQLEAEQARRVKILQETCANMDEYLISDDKIENIAQFLFKLNLPTKPMWQNLYCSKEYKIAYCPLFKVATTFLLKKMLLISPGKRYNKENVKELEVQANVLARKEFGYLDNWEDYPSFTKNGQTVLFVRHPFERILSAFRDKLEDPQVKGRKFNEYYYNKYGRKIVMHYRREKITGPTFKYPRFSEFVEYILNRDVRYDDEHWAPFFKDCSPCQIDYNFIGHFETLYWDVHLLANRTGLAKVWDDPADYFQSSTYMEVSKEYFATVERDQIRKLYNRYKLDFDMFGYSAEEYIAFGKPGPDDILPETTPKQTSVIENEEPGKVEADESREHVEDNQLGEKSEGLNSPTAEVDERHSREVKREEVDEQEDLTEDDQE